MEDVGRFRSPSGLAIGVASFRAHRNPGCDAYALLAPANLATLRLPGVEGEHVYAGLYLALGYAARHESSEYRGIVGAGLTGYCPV